MCQIHFRRESRELGVRSLNFQCKHPRSCPGRRTEAATRPRCVSQALTDLSLSLHIPISPLSVPLEESLGRPDSGFKGWELLQDSVGRCLPWGRCLTQGPGQRIPMLSPEGPAGPLPSECCLPFLPPLYTPLTLEMEGLLLGPHSRQQFPPLPMGTPSL